MENETSQEWDVEWLKFKEAVDDKNLRKRSISGSYIQLGGWCEMSLHYFINLFDDNFWAFFYVMWNSFRLRFLHKYTIYWIYCQRWVKGKQRKCKKMPMWKFFPLFYDYFFKSVNLHISISFFIIIFICSLLYGVVYILNIYLFYFCRLCTLSYICSLYST